MTQNTKCGLNKIKEYKMDYKNVYEALVEVNKDIEAVAKTGYNDFHKFAYATIEEVYAVCREAMHKNNVVLMSEIVENEMKSTITHHKETYNGKVTEKDKTSNYGTVVFNYQFWCGESHTEPIRWVGEAMDTGDKTYSKAISFAQKTFLLTFFNIPRVDANNTHDPDASGTTGKAAPHKQTTQEAKFKKAKTFYLKLFGRDNLNWIDKNNPGNGTFKRLCDKAGVGTWMVAWATEDTEKMRKMLGDAGVKIDATTVINEALCNSIQHNVTQYVSFKPNTLL